VAMTKTAQLEWLRDIFGTADVKVSADALVVAGTTYPIVDGVIVLLDPAQYTPALRQRLDPGSPADGMGLDYAPDIQDTFGAEWEAFARVLPEHRAEFEDYFDLVPLASLEGKTVCDLGCGIGRWSHFLVGHCERLILVDFSDAIFVARQNLAAETGALFFMADLTRLPFRDGFADFLFCLGVLHHLPVPALEAVRGLERCAPLLLIYLYYSLDNRPAHFRALLGAVTLVRGLSSRIRGARLRGALSWLGAVFVYAPLIALGGLLARVGLARLVPLQDSYRGKSLGRIRQDVYDRFFTRIEQRFSRAEIRTLEDTFSEVVISEGLPYWHFVCGEARTSEADSP
jgi:SAM-dependent methyltransferase